MEKQDFLCIVLLLVGFGTLAALTPLSISYGDYSPVQNAFAPPDESVRISGRIMLAEKSYADEALTVEGTDDRTLEIVQTDNNGEFTTTQEFMVGQYIVLTVDGIRFNPIFIPRDATDIYDIGTIDITPPTLLYTLYWSGNDPQTDEVCEQEAV